MARKAAGKPAIGRPFAKGTDARRNTTKAGPGRTPLPFAQACADLQRGVILEKCRKVLEHPRKGPGFKDWEWAAEWVSRYGEREVARVIGVNSGVLLVPVSPTVEQWTAAARAQQASLGKPK